MQLKRKETAGKHHMVVDGKRQRILPGQVVDLDILSIPETMKDGWEVLDSSDTVAFNDAVVDQIAEEDDDAATPEKEVRLQAVHRGGGRFNVVNQATGENLNDNYLTKAQAEQLIDAHQPPSDTKKKARRSK